MPDFVRLGDHIEISKGRPPAELPFDGPGSCLYLTPDYLRGRVAAVAARGASDSVVAKDGDAVLLWDGSNAGEFFLGKQGLVASTMARLRPSGKFDRGFFFHALKHLEPKLKGRTNGTGIPHVDREVLENLRVLAPPTEEQAAIARALDALDTTIRQTESIIEKLKQVKQGLLHDLLTRGIDENGELRPPRRQAPHLYRKSPLGWIPKQWEAKELRDLLVDEDPSMRSGPFGSELLKHELVENGIPLLGIDNVQTEAFSRGFSRFVTEQKFNQLSRYAVRPHDVMITIMGTVGRCCLVPDGIGRALSSKHTWTLSFNRLKYLPLLAMLQINYCEWVLRHFSKDEQGGVMSAIRSETLRSLLLPVPGMDEQLEIAARLQSASDRISSESATMHKLARLKSGLADDLLSGRVRVTPLLDPAPAA